MEELFEEYGEETPILQYLREEINNAIQTEEKLTIGFVGKTGEGKSTLINALIGQKIVPSNAGKEVTAGLIEINFHDSDLFRMEVEFLEKEKVAEYNSYLNAEYDETTDSENAVSKDMVEYWENSLNEMWPDGRPENIVEPHDAIPDSLRKMWEEEVHIVQTKSIEELKTEITKFISYDQEHPWRFIIQKVIIHGRFPALRGLSLLDIPGYGDEQPLSCKRYNEGVAMSNVLVFVRDYARFCATDFFSLLQQKIAEIERKKAIFICVTKCMATGAEHISSIDWNEISEVVKKNYRNGLEKHVRKFKNKVLTEAQLRILQEATVFALENKSRANIEEIPEIFARELQRLHQSLIEIRSNRSEEDIYADYLDHLESSLNVLNEKNDSVRQGFGKNLQRLFGSFEELFQNILGGILTGVSVARTLILETSNWNYRAQQYYVNLNKPKRNIYAQFKRLAPTKEIRLKENDRVCDSPTIIPFWADLLNDILDIGAIKLEVSKFEDFITNTKKLRDALIAGFPKDIQNVEGELNYLSDVFYNIIISRLEHFYRCSKQFSFSLTSLEQAIKEEFWNKFPCYESGDSPTVRISQKLDDFVDNQRENVMQYLREQLQQNFFTLNAALVTIMKDVKSVKEEVIKTVSTPDSDYQKDTDLVSKIRSMLKGENHFPLSESPKEEEQYSESNSGSHQNKKTKLSSIVPVSVITKLDTLEKLKYCHETNFHQNLAHYKHYDKEKKTLFLARREKKPEILVGVTIKDIDSAKSIAKQGGWEIYLYWESKLAKAALTLIEKLLVDYTAEKVTFGSKKRGTHTYKAKASEFLEKTIAPSVVEFIDYWVTESDYLAPGSATKALGIFDKPIPNIKRDVDDEE